MSLTIFDVRESQVEVSLHIRLEKASLILEKVSRLTTKQF